MSTIFGKVADKASILKASGSTLQTAVIKATYHNTKPPKEKHVRTLNIYSKEQEHRIKEIIHLLFKRLEIPDWIVVMKTLCVFHRLLKEAHPRFIDELKNKYKMFNPLKKFVDMSSQEAQHQSLFIRKYSQYIEEKVLLYSLLRCEPDKNPDVVKQWTSSECLDRLPRLQSQLNALLNTKSCRDFINNRIIVFAFSMLLKDSFKVYRALNDGILTLLENYLEMNQQNVAKTLEIYKLFTRETDGINSFFELAKKFSRSELPTLQHAPTGLVETLESHLEDLKQGRAPQVKKSHIDKKKFLETQKNMHGFAIDELSGESDSGEEDDPKMTKEVESWDPFGPSTTAPTNDNKTAPAPTNDPWDPFGPSTTAPTNNNNNSANNDPWGFGAPSNNNPPAPTNDNPFGNNDNPFGNNNNNDPFAPSGGAWANFGGNNPQPSNNNQAPNSDFNPWG